MLLQISPWWPSASNLPPGHHCSICTSCLQAFLIIPCQTHAYLPQTFFLLRVIERQQLTTKCLLTVVCVYIYNCSMTVAIFLNKLKGPSAKWANQRPSSKQTRPHTHTTSLHTVICVCANVTFRSADMPQRVTGSQCPSPSLVPHWSPSVVHAHTFLFDSRPVAVCVLAYDWLHCCKYNNDYWSILQEYTTSVFLLQNIMFDSLLLAVSL